MSYVTNATLRLSSERGFEQDAPIYVVIEDVEGFNVASENWDVLGLSMENAYSEMFEMLQ